MNVIYRVGNFDCTTMRVRFSDTIPDLAVEQHNGYLIPQPPQRIGYAGRIYQLDDCGWLVHTNQYYVRYTLLTN